MVIKAVVAQTETLLSKPKVINLVLDREVDYQKKLSVLGNEEFDIIWKSILARSSGKRDQVVIVDEVVAANSYESKCLVYKLLCLLSSNKGTHPLLVLFEVLILPVHSDYVYLQNQIIS